MFNSAAVGFSIIWVRACVHRIGAQQIFECVLPKTKAFTGITIKAWTFREGKQGLKTFEIVRFCLGLGLLHRQFLEVYLARYGLWNQMNGQRPKFTLY